MGVPDKNYRKRPEGFKHVKAIVQVVDWDKKKINHEISYVPPESNIGNGMSIQFKGASIYNNSYYVVTNTELLCYDMRNWALETVFTHKTFNDLHAVLPTKDRLYILQYWFGDCSGF